MPVPVGAVAPLNLHRQNLLIPMVTEDALRLYLSPRAKIKKSNDTLLSRTVIVEENLVPLVFSTLTLTTLCIIGLTQDYCFLLSHIFFLLILYAKVQPGNIPHISSFELAL